MVNLLSYSIILKALLVVKRFDSKKLDKLKLIIIEI